MGQDRQNCSTDKSAVMEKLCQIIPRWGSAMIRLLLFRVQERLGDDHRCNHVVANVAEK
jgi:hypothetical protein